MAHHHHRHPGLDRGFERQEIRVLHLLDRLLRHRQALVRIHAEAAVSREMLRRTRHPTGAVSLDGVGDDLGDVLMIGAARADVDRLVLRPDRDVGIRGEVDRESQICEVLPLHGRGVGDEVGTIGRGQAHERGERQRGRTQSRHRTAFLVDADRHRLTFRPRRGDLTSQFCDLILRRVLRQVVAHDDDPAEVVLLDHVHRGLRVRAFPGADDEGPGEFVIGEFADDVRGLILEIGRIRVGGIDQRRFGLRLGTRLRIGFSGRSR